MIENGDKPPRKLPPELYGCLAVLASIATYLFVLLGINSLINDGRTQVGFGSHVDVIALGALAAVLWLVFFSGEMPIPLRFTVRSMLWAIAALAMVLALCVRNRF